MIIIKQTNITAVVHINDTGQDTAVQYAHNSNEIDHCLGETDMQHVCFSRRDRK